MRRAGPALQHLMSLTITPSKHPQKKDAQIAYITAPDAAVHSVCGLLGYVETIQLILVVTDKA